MATTPPRSFLIFTLLCAFGTASKAQDRRDWQSVARLQAGDKIRLSLKKGSVTAIFQSWTPQQVTAGTLTARKENVVEIERYRHRGERGKAAVGAMIGFGGGLAVGAAATGCHQGQFGPCVSRGLGGAIAGGAGAVVGAGIGALLPRHTKQLIYSAK
jgi:hypothetical protein